MTAKCVDLCNLEKIEFGQSISFRGHAWIKAGMHNAVEIHFWISDVV